MRRRQLKALWKRLGQLQQMKLTARELLLRLGEAKGRYRAAWRLIEIQLPEPTTEEIASFSFALNRQKGCALSEELFSFKLPLARCP